MHEEDTRKAGTISKYARNHNQHVIIEAAEETILQGLIAANVPDLNIQNYSVKKGTAAITRQLELVNTGSWIKYIKEDMVSY